MLFVINGLCLAVEVESPGYTHSATPRFGVEGARIDFAALIPRNLQGIMGDSAIPGAR
jgi:hypothetical protein